MVIIHANIGINFLFLPEVINSTRSRLAILNAIYQTNCTHANICLFAGMNAQHNALLVGVSDTNVATNYIHIT
jgi:hypothetical protein